MTPIINVDAANKQVTWDLTPPLGMSFITHKFSVIDAVESASAVLGTDYTKEAETITVGQVGHAVFSALPQVILSTPTKDGLMPIENGKGVVGTVGRRKIFYTHGENQRAIIVENPRNKVTIHIVESKPAKL